MVDEFYLDINLELFVQWLYGNQDKYDKNVICAIKNNDSYGKTITFNYYNNIGSIIVWTNGIIEEQIYDDEENVVFYLHYKLVSLSQGQKLFYDFYDALIKQTKYLPIKILICCSDGLSAAFLVSKANELIKLKNLNYELCATGLDELKDNYLNYDAIYLAPQISYLKPQVMNIVHNSIPVHCIPPNVYATNDYQELLDIINEDIVKNRETA